MERFWTWLILCYENKLFTSVFNVALREQGTKPFAQVEEGLTGSDG